MAKSGILTAGATLNAGLMSCLNCQPGRSYRTKSLSRDGNSGRRLTAHGAITEAPVADAALPTAIPHPTGPIGAHPKKWLTPGV